MSIRYLGLQLVPKDPYGPDGLEVAAELLDGTELLVERAVVLDVGDGKALSGVAVQSRNSMTLLSFQAHQEGWRERGVASAPAHLHLCDEG